jgi:hypothetical protein
VAIAALLFLGPLSSASGAAPAAAPAKVLAVYQTSYVTEHSNFTVSAQLSSTTGLKIAFFSFCQLGNGVCFPQIIMTSRGNGWFVGTTRVMSSYHGMAVGVKAGYNVTFSYTNNVNVTMTVSPDVYGLNGYVTDAANGAGVAGAKVALSPGTNATTTGPTGGYTFAGLLNGSYTLSVSAGGYVSTSVPVSISGQNAVKEIGLTNATTSHPTGGAGKGSSAATVFGISVWVFVPAVLVVAALATFLVWRRGFGRRPPPTSAPTRVDAPGPPP